MRRPLSIAALLFAIGIGAWWFTHRHRNTPAPKEVILAEINAELESDAKSEFAGSLLLVHDNSVILRRGYGLADRASGRQVNPDTGFDIGSLVKPFTAAAVFVLESQGRLRTSERLGTFFPEATADKAGITIQQLIDHTSGLPDIVDAKSAPVDYTPDFDYQPVSRDEIVARAMRAKLLFVPGQKSEYSNLGYSLLAVIIEKASGQPYEQYVWDHLFTPAGMSHTGYVSPGWKRTDLAVGYAKGKAWGTPLDHPWLADGPSWNLRGNGGMISTVDDLHRWIEALEKNQILDASARKKFEAFAVHRNSRGTRTMGAAGSNEVFDASFLWYLDEHRVLILLTSSDKYRAEKMIPELAREMRRIR